MSQHFTHPTGSFYRKAWRNFYKKVGKLAQVGRGEAGEAFWHCTPLEQTVFLHDNNQIVLE